MNRIFVNKYRERRGHASFHKIWKIQRSFCSPERTALSNAVIVEGQKKTLGPRFHFVILNNIVSERTGGTQLHQNCDACVSEIRLIPCAR